MTTDSTGVHVAAVDLGASSGRVVVASFATDRLESPGGVTLREVQRFPNVAVRAGRTLRWDALRLWSGIVDGLIGAERQIGALHAVGVDSWAVDYGLLDADGELIGNPICYRDAGTALAMATALELIPEAELYAATGIAVKPFNTIFQLIARRDTVHQRTARHALLIPDLMSYWLSGELGTETTNASTTALLDPTSRTWSGLVEARLATPTSLFPALREPGTVVGIVRPDLGVVGRPAVVTVPSHDTAAAVAGIPADNDAFAFVCTGTWALVGVELPAPCLTEAARLGSFTNEAGVDGTTRFLRNVTGFWLLQECLRQWTAEGSGVDVAELMAGASRVPGPYPVIDVQDPIFAAPGGMPRKIVRAAMTVSGRELTGREAIVRCILDSVAAAIGDAVRDAVRISGKEVRVVSLVGGGVATPLFCQLVADACELPVEAGPTEAAAWGNAIFQARALGILPRSISQNRALIRRNAPPVRYEPATAPQLTRAGRA